MTVQQFSASSFLPYPPDAVFAWHQNSGAFQRLTPPFDPVRLIRSEGIGPGALAELEMRLGPIPIRWIARHEALDAGVGFRDVQVKGPFARWEHVHAFDPEGSGTRMRDCVTYALPAGAAGSALGGAGVRKKLSRLFAYRHEAVARDLACHSASGLGDRKLNFVLAGSSGLVGTQLAAFLATGGHDVLRLVRPGATLRAGQPGRVLEWDPGRGVVDADVVRSADVVINLAGAGIADEKWSPERKALIRSSRVETTDLLARTLASSAAPGSKVLVNASAIGFYGDGGDAQLTEESPSGSNWLAEICRAWEAATGPAESAGVRVVHARIGIVLSPLGGSLGQMLPIFRAGVAGRLGHGKQWFPWISIDDVVAALHAVAVDARFSGPVNLTAPEPVTNAAFTKALAKAVKRPALMPVPPFALKALYGEMAQMLLTGARVLPQRLSDAGFGFRHQALDCALATVLGTGPVPKAESTDNGFLLKLG